MAREGCFQYTRLHYPRQVAVLSMMPGHEGRHCQRQDTPGALVADGTTAILTIARAESPNGLSQNGYG